MPSPDSDAAVVFDLLDGFRASKAVFVAVSWRLFDRLHGRDASLSELSAELDAAPHALERLLGYCVSRGLLSLDQAGRYANTPASDRFLRVDSPETLSGYVLYSDRILYRMWGRLADAVREGTNRWEQEFGPKDDIFEHFFSTDEEKEEFLRGMHGLGLLGSPAVVAAFDLGRFETMADLGGGTGHLVIEACRQNAGLRGKVFDLPAVKPVAERYVAEAGLSERIEVIPGNFFADPFPPADLYAIGRILHDWSEEKVRVLLRKIADALPAGGGLLIAEKILDEDKCGPPSALLQSLNMLVCTEGRERSAAEYEALCREAGFSGFEAALTGRPVDVMLATK